MTTGKVLLGVLSGIAVGALAGILFAPEKGTKTRRQIVQKGTDYADGLKEQFDNFVDTVTSKFERAKKDIEIMAENGKAKYEESKKDSKQMIS
jgi:gas vesicle protein